LVEEGLAADVSIDDDTKREAWLQSIVCWRERATSGFQTPSINNKSRTGDYFHSLRIAGLSSSNLVLDTSLRSDIRSAGAVLRSC